MGRDKREWEDFITINLKEISWESVDWIYRDGGAGPEKTEMNSLVPYAADNVSSSRGIIKSWSKTVLVHAMKAYGGWGGAEL